MRLVALEAGRKVDLGVRLLVRSEILVLPFAIADLRRILGAPAGALLHHREADQLPLDEAPASTLDGLALRIELRPILDHRHHGAARDRLALAPRLDRPPGGVMLA